MGPQFSQVIQKAPNRRSSDEDSSSQKNLERPSLSSITRQSTLNETSIKLMTSIDERNIDKQYHEIEDHGYFLPKDIETHDQLELQHYVLRHAFKGDIVSPNIKKLLKIPGVKVLDAGFRKGLWLDSVMKVFPAPQYFGV
ncbi:hypothetical protein HK100_009559, partial [Physocladia obscura]